MICMCICYSSGRESPRRELLHNIDPLCNLRGSHNFILISLILVSTPRSGRTTGNCSQVFLVSFTYHFMHSKSTLNTGRMTRMSSWLIYSHTLTSNMVTAVMGFVVEELIRSRGNFCMMLSHPPSCLKGIPSSNNNMFAIWNMRGEWGGGYIRKL